MDSGFGVMPQSRAFRDTGLMFKGQGFEFHMTNRRRGPVRNFCVRVRSFVFVLGIDNFDRSKSRSRRLEGPSRSAFRSIKLAKIPHTKEHKIHVFLQVTRTQKLRTGPSPFVI